MYANYPVLLGFTYLFLLAYTGIKRQQNNSCKVYGKYFFSVAYTHTPELPKKKTTYDFALPYLSQSFDVQS